MSANKNAKKMLFIGPVQQGQKRPKQGQKVKITTKSSSTQPFGKRGGAANDTVLVIQQPTKRGPRNQTGAAYKDGFDHVNTQTQRKIRKEAFDELVLSLDSSGESFAIESIPLNPGLMKFGKRISKLASLFQKYKFSKLEFYYIHGVSQFNTLGNAGYVTLSGLYDAAQAAPEDREEQSQTNPHVIGMPCESVLLRMDPRRMHPNNEPLYVRTGHVPGGTDIKTYDAGTLYASVEGQTESGPVGELHVRGEVLLYDEVTEATLSPPKCFHACMVSGDLPSVQTLTTNAFAQVIFPDLDTPNFMGLHSEDSINWSLPAGTYLISWTATFVNTASVIQQAVIEFVRNSSTETQTNFTLNPAATSLMQAVSLKGDCLVALAANETFHFQALAVFASGTTTLGSFVKNMPQFIVIAV